MSSIKACIDAFYLNTALVYAVDNRADNSGAPEHTHGSCKYTHMYKHTHMSCFKILYIH